MPHFDEQGRDTAICQICGTITHDVQWRHDLTGGSPSACNVCRDCRETLDPILAAGRGACDADKPALRNKFRMARLELRAAKDRPALFGKDAHQRFAPLMQLEEYAAKESGYAPGSLELRDYINRYYGHG